jgi:2-keto-4-pentenoate hydratase/2-oxohepta-3-ene-1,7-dioic acid hydratase in catechol pathway
VAGAPPPARAAGAAQTGGGTENPRLFSAVSYFFLPACCLSARPLPCLPMKIICIGRNYADHVAELQNEIPTAPVIFMKPETALIQRGQPFFYPDFSTDVHYELELVLRISKNGRHIEEQFANTYFDAISLGIDFTARDLQSDLKKKGLPWELAKAFDGSAPVSPTFKPATEFADFTDINFRLEVNGEVRQQGNSSLMMYPFAKIISFVSRYITLKQGDLIFTGTPAGVGPVQVGDQLVGYLGEEKILEVAVR